MGDVTLNPVAFVGANVHGDSDKMQGNVDGAAEVGVAVTDHVKKGGFEGFFSFLSSVSYTGGEKRVSGSAVLTGMLFYPLLLTGGPRISYNLDKKGIEAGAMGCAQTVISVHGNTGYFGGLCFTANNVSNLKNDGVSGFLTFTGQL